MGQAEEADAFRFSFDLSQGWILDCLQNTGQDHLEAFGAIGHFQKAGSFQPVFCGTGVWEKALHSELEDLHSDLCFCTGELCGLAEAV